ncbi:MAG: PAS domain S-box protein [Tepidisphaeraceae bacterium]
MPEPVASATTTVFHPSDALLQATLLAAPVAIVVVKNRVLCSCNDHACQMFGYQRDELLGKSTRVLYSSAEEYEAVGRHVLGSMTSGEQQAIEARHRRKDGTLIHVLLKAAPLNAKDPSAGSVVAAMDMTHRARAVRAVLDNADRMEVLLKLNQMSDASVAQIADFALEEGTRLSGSSLGYLAFASNDESEVTMYAWSRQATADCNVASSRRHYSLAEAGLWAEAVRQRQPVITNDYAAAGGPRKGLPAGHVPLRRHMSIPVLSGGRIVAVAGVGNKVEPYDRADVQQLTLVMEGMWRHIERKRVLDSLAASEARFRTLFETAPYATVINRLSDGAFLAVNPAFERNSGCSSADVLGKTPVELGLVSDECVLGAQVFRRDGKIDNGIEICKDRWGETKHLHYASRSLVFNGEPAVLTSTVDITEQKLAEQALRESQRRLMDIIDFLPDPTFAIDTAGRVIAWNRAIEQLTRVPKTEILGRGDQAYAMAFYGRRRPMLIDLVLDDSPELRAQFDRVWNQGCVILGETYDRTLHQGKGAYLWATATALLNERGEAAGAIESFRDTTEYRRMEQMLMQSEKMRTVGGLAAGVAHEINNPLAVMMQSAEVAAGRVAGDLPANRQAAQRLGLSLGDIQAYLKTRELPDLLEAIQQAGERASRVVRNMLSFSRTGATSLSPHALPELIDRSVELAMADQILKQSRMTHEIEIRPQYDAHLPEVRCDPGQIQQLFMNLIKNAIQAIAGQERQSRPPCIGIRVRARGENVEIEFEDNGPGMDEDTSHRLFEPFFTTKPPGEGTGLGLFVCYAIVTRNHGGTISVTSRPGHGTLFVITLPVHGRRPDGKA